MNENDISARSADARGGLGLNIRTNDNKSWTSRSMPNGVNPFTRHETAISASHKLVSPHLIVGRKYLFPA